MYTDYHVVDFRDVDRNYNIKFPAILQIISTAATKHFNDRGFEPMYLSKKNLAWVVYEATINMNRTKLYANILRIETFVKATKNVYYTRYFTIYDDNDELIGTATSKWVVIDFEKKSLTKIPPEIIEAFPFDESLLNDDHRLAMNTKKVKCEEMPFTDEKIFDIRYFDIDPNFHVNNTIYAAWAVESLDNEDFLEKHKVTSMNVIFKNECPYTEKQVKVVYYTDGSQSHHDIFTMDGKLLCILDFELADL